MSKPATALHDYNPYWAECFGIAPELPMSRAEMDALGWDSCDIIIVTGDAYVDHPSFGMAIIGRLLEANGFRVGIIAQPNWQSKDAFMELGKPNLYFGVAAGNILARRADRKLELARCAAMPRATLFPEGTCSQRESPKIYVQDSFACQQRTKQTR